MQALNKAWYQHSAESVPRYQVPIPTAGLPTRTLREVRYYSSTCYYEAQSLPTRALVEGRGTWEDGDDSGGGEKASDSHHLLQVGLLRLGHPYLIPTSYA